jgi:hypothetical protein
MKICGVVLPENMLTWASHLSPTDKNIHLLQSQGASKLLPVRGTTEPASQMFQETMGSYPCHVNAVIEPVPMTPTHILLQDNEERQYCHDTSWTSECDNKVIIS